MKKCILEHGKLNINTFDNQYEALDFSPVSMLVVCFLPQELLLRMRECTWR